MKAAEPTADRRVAVEPPVAEHPDLVAVDLDRRAFVDDQRPGQAARHLLVAALVRMVEERAGVGQRELVEEALAGTDGRLGEVRHAVHRVRQTDAVPVHGRALVEAVLHLRAQPVTLPQAQGGARHRAVVGPDRGTRILDRHELGRSRFSDQPRLDK